MQIYPDLLICKK